MTIILQTPRLTLRPLVAEDAEALYCIYQTADVLKYFPNPVPPPLEKVQRFITNDQAHWDIYEYGNWGIVPQGEKQIIGWAGLQFVSELHETEVGYLLAQPFWGKGLATEAALASLQFGFEQCEIDHLIGLVHPENLASQHVLKKCGMTYRETIQLWGIDLLKYRIDRNQP